MAERILNIAHRGARSLAPENTLAAALKAHQAGADMWELDVGVTADGELVVLHDDTLNRTTNVEAVFPERAHEKLHTFSLDEIRQLDAGSWFVQQDPFGQIAAGNVTDQDCASYQGVQIPTLVEALRFTRDLDWRVNIEIKDLAGSPGDAVVVERVVYEVKKLGMMERVLLSSFNPDYVLRSKAAAADIQAALLVNMPKLMVVSMLRKVNADAYHPRRGAISPYRVQYLRRLGYDVNVWSVNEAAEMRRFINARATGLFTDFPQVLARVLSGEI